MDGRGMHTVQSAQSRGIDHCLSKCVNTARQVIIG